jgi:hypothetical protein
MLHMSVRKLRETLLRPSVSRECPASAYALVPAEGSISTQPGIYLSSDLSSTIYTRAIYTSVYTKQFIITYTRNAALVQAATPGDYRG